METLIVILIVVAVAVAVVFMKRKQQDTRPSKPKAPPPGDPEWVVFLETVNTVFRGGTKKQQDQFLRNNLAKIKRFKEQSYEFETKFNAIVNKYKK